MIQSDKFDSFNMDIKKITNTASNFIIKRLIEILGLLIFFLALMLMVALITYSPEDPNFIFSEGTKIENLLGYKGSFTADIFFQSIGLISYLVAITLLITGMNIVIKKQILLIIDSVFFITLYSLLGSLFLNHFYNDSLALHINGNGGFVGNFINNTFVNNLINSQENISYYFLVN